MNSINTPLTQNMVYHEKYGYIKEKSLQKKFIRHDLNHTHLCVLAAILLSTFLSFVLSMVLSTFAPYMLMTTGLPPYLYYIINMFGSAFTIGLPFFVYLAFRKEGVNEYLRFKKNPKFDSLLLVFAAAGLCMLANYPSMLIMELVEGAGLDGGAQESLAGTNAFESVLYFLTIAVFPPLFEEFAFRGVMLSTLRKHGDGFALVVSSVAFALMHASISAMPFALICGFAMGYVYLRTENLWLCVFIHFINNANATIPGILILYLPEDLTNLISNIIFYALILLGIIAFVVLLVRKTLVSNEESQIKRCISCGLSFGGKLSAYFTSVGTLAALIVTIGMIVLSMLGMY